MSMFSSIMLGVLFGLGLVTLVALGVVLGWLGWKLVCTSNAQGVGRLWSWVMYLSGLFLLLFHLTFVCWWPQQKDPFRETVLGVLPQMLCVALVVAQVWAVGYLVGGRPFGKDTTAGERE